MGAVAIHTTPCFLFRFAAIGALLLGFNAGVQAETPAVRMQVYGIHQGNDIIYNYTLINNSAETLRHFVVGSIQRNVKTVK